jgi:hypothetical protein
MSSVSETTTSLATSPGLRLKLRMRKSVGKAAGSTEVGTSASTSTAATTSTTSEAGGSFEGEAVSQGRLEDGSIFASKGKDRNSHDHALEILK